MNGNNEITMEVEENNVGTREGDRPGEKSEEEFVRVEGIGVVDVEERNSKGQPGPDTQHSRHQMHGKLYTPANK